MRIVDFMIRSRVRGEALRAQALATEASRVARIKVALDKYAKYGN